jgi:hypothetical protein
MKKLLVLTVLLLGCLCIAQDTQADFPAAARIFFSDGTDIQLQCAQDGMCRVMRSTAPSVVTRVNLGFSTKHGYTLLVK